MSDAFKVLRSFERYDEKAAGVKQYTRGSIIYSKEAAKITSLPTLLASGNILRLPEELSREQINMRGVG